MPPHTIDETAPWSAGVGARAGSGCHDQVKEQVDLLPVLKTAFVLRLFDLEAQNLERVHLVVDSFE